MSRFTKLTESQFNEKIEKQNYVDKEEFGEYQAAIDKDLMEGFQKLEQLKKSSANFQEYSIYEIELADQFIINDSLIRADLYSGNLTTPLHIAVQKYHGILAKKQYSMYLFEAWFKWRAASQIETGMGMYDDIPNNEYDDMREQMVAVSLDYIARHPQDDMAINLLLILATDRIVSRFDEVESENIEEWNDKGTQLV